MLYITQFKDEVTEWHVGEPIPEVTARVVTFQADSEELEVILTAIKSASKESI